MDNLYELLMLFVSTVGKVGDYLYKVLTFKVTFTPAVQNALQIVFDIATVGQWGGVLTWTGLMDQKILIPSSFSWLSIFAVATPFLFIMVFLKEVIK